MTTFLLLAHLDIRTNHIRIFVDDIGGQFQRSTPSYPTVFGSLRLEEESLILFVLIQVSSIFSGRSSPAREAIHLYFIARPGAFWRLKETLKLLSSLIPEVSDLGNRPRFSSPFRHNGASPLAMQSPPPELR